MHNSLSVFINVQWLTHPKKKKKCMPWGLNVHSKLHGVKYFNFLFSILYGLKKNSREKTTWIFFLYIYYILRHAWLKLIVYSSLLEPRFDFGRRGPKFITNIHVSIPSKYIYIYICLHIVVDVLYNMYYTHTIIHIHF